MATLRFKTGQESNLPSEAELGQPLFTQDTNKLFIGKGTGNPLTEINTSVFILRQGIINPDCAVAQRAVPSLSTSYQYGMVDRFAVKATGTAVTAGTITQKTTSTATTSGKSLYISGATITGSGVVYARYRMESKDAVNFKNLAASFGLKVLHDVGSAINYTITVNKANAADDFSAVTQVAISGSLSVATGTATTIKLENISLGDVTNGLEFIVQATCGAVTTKNFEFGEWQFNKGATILSFTARNYAEELASCERYLKNIPIYTPIRSSYIVDVNNIDFSRGQNSNLRLSSPTLVGVAVTDWDVATTSGTLQTFTSASVIGGALRCYKLAHGLTDAIFYVKTNYVFLDSEL